MRNTVFRVFGTVFLALAAVADAQDDVVSAVPLLYPPPQTQTAPSTQNAGDNITANPISAPTPRIRQQLPVTKEPVSIPVLAQRLRRIDPSTEVEWDGKLLRITSGYQKFSIFPKGKQIVVNGTPRIATGHLVIDNGELFVEPDLMDFIEKTVKNVVEATPVPKATPTPITIDLNNPDEQVTTTVEVTPQTTDPADAETSVSPSKIALENPDIFIPEMPAPAPTATPEPKPTPTPKPKPTQKPKPIETPKPTATPATVDLGAVTTGTKLDVLRAENARIKQLKLQPHSLAELSAIPTGKLQTVLIDCDLPADRTENKTVIEAVSTSIKLAQCIEEELKAAGVETIIIDKDANRSSVAARMNVVQAQRGKAQVMLSLRIGSGPSTTAQGTRVFYMNESVDANAIEPLNGNAIPPERTYQVFALQNKRLATQLARVLSDARGSIKPVPLATWLGRRVPMPYVIIEAGNIANATDANTLRDSAKIQALAKSIATTLTSFEETAATTPDEALLPETPQKDDKGGNN